MFAPPRELALQLARSVRIRFASLSASILCARERSGAADGRLGGGGHGRRLYARPAACNSRPKKICANKRESLGRSKTGRRGRRGRLLACVRGASGDPQAAPSRDGHLGGTAHGSRRQLAVELVAHARRRPRDRESSRCRRRRNSRPRPGSRARRARSGCLPCRRSAASCAPRPAYVISSATARTAGPDRPPLSRAQPRPPGVRDPPPPRAAC